MKLHADIHDGTGPYLLLIHGILSSRAQFECNLAALATVARPVTVELWGHGRSPVPDDPALFHPDAYVAAFEELRERLGVERWLICGQSLGAALTLRYALDFPERIVAQIFTNSVAAFSDATWADAIRQTGPAQAEALIQGGRAAIGQMPFHPKHATRLPDGAKALLLKDAEGLSPAGVARTIQYTVPESPVRERIVSNTVPALLVCGTREKGFEGHREFVERCMPALETCRVEAGHAVNIEAAEIFNEAAVAFIARHTGG